MSAKPHTAKDLLKMRSESEDYAKLIRIVEEPHKGCLIRSPENTVPSLVPWISVSFPFNRSLIDIIERLTREIKSYTFDNSGNRYYFRCDEENVLKVIGAFRHKGFEVDDELTNLYNKLTQIIKNKKDYLPIVEADRLVNFHPVTENYLLEKLGPPKVSNIVKYKDRAIQFGISGINQSLLQAGLKDVSTLTSKLVARESPTVLIRPTEWTLDDIVLSLIELDRLPLLVLVSTEDALRDLKLMHSALNKYVDPAETAVLFRLDNEKNADFNKYVKDQGLNNTVNKSTKVVYVSKDKLPKPLLKSKWAPSSVLRLGSYRIQTKIDHWIYESDLVMHYDRTATQWQPSQVKRRKTQTL